MRGAKYDRRMATIVVLNGTSSSGKTTLARAFQELAPAVFLYYSVDSIFSALPQSIIARIVAGQVIPELPFKEIHDAFHACVAALAARGRDLIIDNSITSRTQAESLAAAVEGHRVLLVGVSCAREILEQRERARGDRNRGLATRQLGTIDRWLEYDLRIDTSNGDVEAGAARILEALAASELTAFARTRSRLSQSE